MTTGRARLFVAILLPARVRSALADGIRDVREEDGDVRWVPIGQLHLTLRFLGSVDRGRIEGLEAHLREAAGDCEGFDLVLSGTGAFPRLSRPRVFWVGVQPTPGLGALHGRVSTAIEDAGFERDERSFRPHVTIGRVRRGRQAPGDVIDAVTSATVRQRVAVASIALVESTLGPGGARHDVAATFPLRAPVGPPDVNGGSG